MMVGQVMRRWGSAVLVGGLGVALAVAGSATASHEERSSSPREFAVGSAKNRFFDVGGPNHLSVSAQGIPPSVTGYVRASGDFGGEFQVQGKVTCLLVEGNRASIKYRFDRSVGSTAAFEGGGVQVFIEDNGEPRNGQAVDANSTHAPMNSLLFELSNPEQCDDPTAGEPYNPVDSGNYTVHDAGN